MASRETDSLIAYLRHSGVPHRVTWTTGGQHAAGSYHFRQGTDGYGLAVDFAGPVPSSNSPELRAIYDVFRRIRGRLAELFGPGDPGHADHVHVAVPLGFTWEVPVPDDPNLANITAPVEVHLVVDSNGRCTGYYFISLKTGEIHTFGPGAVYYGRPEIVS